MTAKLDISGIKPVLLLEIALAAVLLIVLANTVSPLFSKKQVISPSNSENSQAAYTGNTVNLDAGILRKFDPFHRDAKPAGQIPEMVISAPETTLNLKVFGMRADTVGESSSAIIQTPDSKQATYFIGQEIIPGVTLERVDIDFVILDRNGVKERLSRQGKAEGDKPTGDTIAMAALAFKAQDMINDLRFYPHREGREVIGYRMRSRRGQSLEKYGFRQNDLITAINGESLAQNRVNLPNLWKNLKQARYASIQIIRDDMPMTIEVNLQ